MADIKTELRETSVIVGVLYYTDCLSLQYDDIFIQENYVNVLTIHLKNDIMYAKNLRTLKHFTPQHINIINNGFKLAQRIVSIFNLKEITYLKWLGYETQSSFPVDIIINEHHFSLKEESYILENMGLYKLLTIFTGIPHSRGVHVFKKYAPVEYNDWFKYTWNKIISKQRWELQHKNNKATFLVANNYLSVNYHSDKVKITRKIPITIESINEYEQFTTAILREKVFAKFISNELKNDPTYESLKKECAIAAGRNLTTFLNNNLNYDSIARFLQIYDESYYYAKTTDSQTIIYSVPAVNDYSNIINIKSINYSVPVSQLNIITVVQNEVTKKELVLRNEC